MGGFGYYCYNKTELTEDSYRVLFVCLKNATKGTNAYHVLIKLTEVF